MYLCVYIMRWLAMSNTGSLLVLDAHPDGIIYRELVPEYVDVVRTIYEGTIHTNTHFHVCIYTVCMYMAYVYLCVCPMEDHNKYTSTLYVYVHICILRTICFPWMLQNTFLVLRFASKGCQWIFLLRAGWKGLLVWHKNQRQRADVWVFWARWCFINLLCTR